MVDLPGISEQIVTSEAPRSAISVGEVAAPYQRLGQALDKVGEGLEKVAVPLAERAGYEAVATDEQGNMTVNRLPILGEAGVAYNRALKFSALAQADGAAKRKDIEISKQFPNDPEGYLTAADKFRETMVKNTTSVAGPEVGEALDRYINTSTTFNYRRLLNEQQQTIKANFDKDTKWAIESKSEALKALCENGGCNTPQAKELITEIHSILGERSNNPLLSAPKSESDRITTQLNADMEAGVFAHKVKGMLVNPAAPYQSNIEASAQKFGVDPMVLARQLYQESGFRENAVSPAGAQGIAQFMPVTAARYGVDVRSPQSSIEGAAHYMADLQRQFGGNTGLALAGYNWGEGKVAQWMASGANPATMPRETRNYVQAITGQPIEAWIRGERPSQFAVQNLPQFGGGGGVQNALNAVEAMRTDPTVDPVQRQVNYERGLAAIKDYHDDVVRRTNMATLGQKATNEAFENSVIADQASGKPTITENDIKTMPGISPESRMRMLKWIKQEDMPEPLARVSQGNAMELFKRINLPDGDPSKIGSIGAIRDAYTDGKLTRTDEDWLEKKFAEIRSPEGERLSQVRAEFSKAAEAAIDKSNPLAGITDPDGKLRAYNYQRFVDQKIAEYRTAGKSPFDLFDPAKPDYLGKPEVLQPYTQTLQQAIQATSNRLRGATAPAAPPPPPPTFPTVPSPVTPTAAAPAPPIAPPPAKPQRQPGETPAQYMERITGAPPVTP